jgi:predicted DNA binding CopG/RHH family protein
MNLKINAESCVKVKEATSYLSGGRTKKMSRRRRGGVADASEKRAQPRFYRLTIRLTPEIYEWVSRRACEENMPAAMFIRQVLRDVMRAEKRHA